MFPLGPPSCSTGIGVAGTDARVISKITRHLVALTGIGASPVTVEKRVHIHSKRSLAEPRGDATVEL